MGEFTARVTIARPAAEVWALIGRFGDLRWYHGVKACTMNGDVRTVINFKRPDLEIDERETAHDDAGRTYSYILSGFRGETIKTFANGDTFDFSALTNHLRCRLSVTPLAASSCLVTYELAIDEGYDSDLEATGAGYQHCVDHLKQTLER
jgi:hypothetical protein